MIQCVRYNSLQVFFSFCFTLLFPWWLHKTVKYHHTHRYSNLRPVSGIKSDKENQTWQTSSACQREFVTGSKSDALFRGDPERSSKYVTCGWSCGFRPAVPALTLWSLTKDATSGRPSHGEKCVETELNVLDLCCCCCCSDYFQKMITTI